ncbi:S1C family serine protease [Granulicella mallensis]|uniref:Peptidase S1 and S6 chymotrypsin/Hap n=1 Tax=Granulicella mallensis (strain ATCC BAA-1857 / DSM 23137 / MP5ACTX8) TaxID=682795 RepID=G8NTC6_GRAMM|nr:trypsin-like peptidase domain-containing protein [Granulicella mallensis]AEU38638.1 peptidase S1 and S6 chymotrypsin/Hap [Granulicella mallensis MP5ACTX8]
MKLRPVLLVILIVCGFYYLTTRMMPVGALAGLLHHSLPLDGTTTSTLSGPAGSLSLTEANAAPAFDAEEQQNIAVYKRALPSVVNITSTAVAFDFFYGPVPQQGQGSGFILNKEGLILTNNHVIDNAQRVEVTLSDKHQYKAKVLTTDKAHDLALIKIENAPNLVPATLAGSQGLTVGQRVYAIGNPFGLSGTMTRGIISAIRSIRGQEGNPIEDAIQTDAAVNPGNSGGPLLNSRGEVIGITTLIASNPNGGADQSAGIGFAIPIDTAKAVLDDFAKYGHVRRPSLDIVTLPIGPDIADQIGLPAEYGILIERVLPGGAAERAGLHGGTQKAWEGNTPVMLGGDLIVEADGQTITTPQDLSNVLNAHHAGDTISLAIFRGHQKMSVKVTLSDAKEAASGQSV